MRELASTVRSRLEALALEYDQRLSQLKGFSELSAEIRLASARQDLALIANGLDTANADTFMAATHQRVVEQIQAGVELESMLLALAALHEVLQPWITRVEDGTFLWRVMAQSSALVAQIAASQSRDSAAREAYRQLVNRLPVGVYRSTLDGRVLEANPAALRIGGLDSLEALNQYGLINLYDDPRDREAILTQIQTQGVVTDYACRFRRPNRQLAQISVSVRLIQDEHGTPQFLEGTLEDITERKQVEQALARRAEQLATLNRVGLSIAAALDMDQVLMSLYEQCKQIVPADTFYVALYDAPTGQIRFPLFLDHGQPVTMNSHDIHTRPGLSGHVIRSRQTLYLPDTLDPEIAAAFQIIRSGGEPTRSFVGVPVILRDQVIGVISAQSYPPNAYTPEQINLLETIGAQAAVALENARLYEIAQQELAERKRAEEALQQRAAQQQDQARRLRATLEAADELIQISDLERLCRRAVELAREKLDIERCGLYLVEADGQHIVGTYGTDDHGNTTDERFSHPPIEDYEFILSLPRTELWAVRDGQHTYWDRNKQRIVGKGWSAGTVLRSATGPIGVLFNDTAISGKPIDGAQQDTLGIYCSLLGSIITRKRLEQQIAASLARRDVQVHTSTEVAQEIAAAPALEELFRRVVTLVKDRFDYYHTQIFRYDSVQDAVVLVAGYGEAGRAMLAAGHKLDMGRGVVGTAAATGVSVLATDVRQDQDWRPNPNLPDTQGELAVPITLRGYPGGKLRDQVLGILDVQSRQANALTAEDQLLLEGLCGQIAVAINNRQTQESLLREQYLMNTLMENFPAGIYFKDTRSRFIQASREVINAFGLSDPAEIVGKTDFDFFTEEHARPAYEDEQRIIRTGQPVSQEEKETRPDGRITWALVNKLPLRDQAGNIVGTFGVTLNITDRKRAEEVVRRSQTELSQALQIAKLAYWEYDVEKDLFLFNDQFYAIFHTTAEQEGGYQLPSARYSQRFVHPDDLPIVGSEIEKALKSTDRHYSRQLDHRILYADGGVGYISVSINIDRDEQGRILRYYGANQDITERKQTEATVQETLEELERLYRSTTREGWQSYRETGKLPTGYVFDRGTLQPNEDVWFPEIEQAIQKNALVQPVTPGAPTVSPLSVHGEVIGALGVMNDPRQHLTPEETGLIASVSEQVAQALESARLFEQTQSARREAEARLREVQILQQVTQQVSGTLDIEQVMDALVNTLSHEMNFSYIALNLIDQESKTMRTERAIGLASGLNGMVRPLAQMQNDILTDVARKGKTEVIDGWDPRFDRELFEQQGHATLVRAYVPLMLRDQAVGVLEVGYRRGERPGIAPEEINLLDSLAGQVAITIQNTQLYRQTQARARREQILREVTARLRSSTDPDTVMRTLARELGTVLGRPAFVRLAHEGETTPAPKANGNGREATASTEGGK